MTLKEVINELRNDPINAYYFIQGHLNLWYDKHYGLPWRKKRYILEKFNKAKACVDNTFCLACGCDTIPMLYSDKPCPAPKYLNKEQCFGIKNT